MNRRITFSSHCKACVVAVPVCLAMLGVTWSVIASSRLSHAPTPTGSRRIGTVHLQVVDHNRQDPYRMDGSRRELLLQLWYPTATVQECKIADYASPQVWAYLSQITGVSLPRVQTNSCMGASVAPGSHPVIVFSHGYTGMLTDSTFLFEDLASRGYVVVSVAHTYETTVVEFPDARLIPSVLGSYLTDDLLADDQSLTQALATRIADLGFVLNELAFLNSRSDNPFSGKLDVSRIGVMGHSLGAVAAIMSLAQEPRFRAAVMIDAPMLTSVKATTKPVLILAAGRDQWTDDDCRLWNNLRGPRMAINLHGTEHLTPTDAVADGNCAGIGNQHRYHGFRKDRCCDSRLCRGLLRHESSWQTCSPALKRTIPKLS